MGTPDLENFPLHLYTEVFVLGVIAEDVKVFPLEIFSRYISIRLPIQIASSLCFYYQKK